MRVTFVRFADHEWGHVLIARDDGVVYRMNTGPITAELPHDLVHYTVEDALRMPDGIWGSIAGGVVFGSMHHVSGRRPPHAAERSKTLIREHRELLQRAELVGGLCERAAHAPDLARFAAAEPWQPLSPDQLGTAVTALRAAAARWSALAVGERLELDWPGHRRLGEQAGPGRPPHRRRAGTRRR